MGHETISIDTGDGRCATQVLTPSDGHGPWPAVIFYMDGLAIRPALIAMAARLAENGYVVLLPDMFYRFGPYETLDPKQVFTDGNIRERLAPMLASIDNEKAARDTTAFLAFLDSRSDVAGAKIGTTGYCMGGGMSLTAAGTFPERVAAAASFHGGSLATDDPHSPHRLAPRMQAEVYVGGADNDPTYPPEMAERLEQALSEAGVKHESEFYSGALHGWTMTDFPIYNRDAAEKGWAKLLALFERALK